MDPIVNPYAAPQSSASAIPDASANPPADTEPTIIVLPAVDFNTRWMDFRLDLDGAIKIAGKVTRADNREFKAARKTWERSQNPGANRIRWWRFLSGASVVTFVLMLLVFGASWEAVLKSIWWTVLLVGGLISVLAALFAALLGYVVLRTWRDARRFYRHNGWAKPIETWMTASPLFFVGAGPLGMQISSWEAFTGYFEAPRLLVLIAKKQTLYFIPAHHVADEEQWQRLLKLVRTKVAKS